MRQRKTGTHWEMEIIDNVAVARFDRAEAFDEIDAMVQAHTELVQRDKVTAHVACLDFDENAGGILLEKAFEAAKIAAENDVSRWAVACPGIGKLAVKNEAKKVDNLEAAAFDTEDPAVEWARTGV